MSFFNSLLKYKINQIVCELFFYVKCLFFSCFCIVKLKGCIFTTEIRNSIKKDFLLSISMEFQQHLHKKGSK